MELTDDVERVVEVSDDFLAVVAEGLPSTVDRLTKENRELRQSLRALVRHVKENHPICVAPPLIRAAKLVKP